MSVERKGEMDGSAAGEAKVSGIKGGKFDTSYSNGALMKSEPGTPSEGGDPAKAGYVSLGAMSYGHESEMNGLGKAELEEGYEEMDKMPAGKK